MPGAGGSRVHRSRTEPDPGVARCGLRLATGCEASSLASTLQRAVSTVSDLKVLDADGPYYDVLFDRLLDSLGRVSDMVEAGGPGRGLREAGWSGGDFTAERHGVCVRASERPLPTISTPE